eukprot:759147-Hanusia_phi.AAC.1
MKDHSRTSRSTGGGGSVGRSQRLDSHLRVMKSVVIWSPYRQSWANRRGKFSVTQPSRRPAQKGSAPGPCRASVEPGFASDSSATSRGAQADFFQ